MQTEVASRQCTTCVTLGTENFVSLPKTHLISVLCSCRTTVWLKWCRLNIKPRPGGERPSWGSTLEHRAPEWCPRNSLARARKFICTSWYPGLTGKGIFSAVRSFFAASSILEPLGWSSTSFIHNAHRPDILASGRKLRQLPVPQEHKLNAEAQYIYAMFYTPPKHKSCQVTILVVFELFLIHCQGFMHCSLHLKKATQTDFWHAPSYHIYQCSTVSVKWMSPQSLSLSLSSFKFPLLV